MNITDSHFKSSITSPRIIGMRPMTFEELLGFHHITEQNVSPEELYKQTKDPAFLLYISSIQAQQDSLLHDPYIGKDYFPEELMTLAGQLFYRNVQVLLKQGQVGLDAASRNFSNLNKRSIYAAFCKGQSYNLISMRLVQEIILAFDLQKEEIEMMLTAPIYLLGKPYIGKCKKSEASSKELFGQQIKLLIEESDLPKITESDMPERIKSVIRKAMSGRIYLHLDSFFMLTHYYRCDLIVSIENLLKLNNMIKCNSQFRIFDPAKPKTESISEGAKEKTETFSAGLKKILGKEKNRSVHLLDNMDYIQRVSPKLYRKCSAEWENLKTENTSLILFCLSKILKCNQSDLLFSNFAETMPAQLQAEIELLHENQRCSDVSAQEKQSDEKQTATHLQHRSSAVEPTAQISKKEEGVLAVKRFLDSEVLARKFVECSPTDWRNESAASEYGFYWTDVPNDDPLMEGFKHELSMLNMETKNLRDMQDLAKKYFGDTRMKIHIRILGDGYEVVYNFNLFSTEGNDD